MVSKDEMQRKMQQTHALRQAIAGTLAGQDSVAVLRKVLRWAESRCPCHEEKPDPCTLCGASVANLEPCKSAERTLPLNLLADIRAALQAQGADGAVAYLVVYPDRSRTVVYEKPAPSMFSAIGATITPLYAHSAASGAAAVGDAEWSMTRAQVEQWIDACNHSPAREALRHYLQLREAALATAPVGVEVLECGFMYADGVHTPTVLVGFKPDDWAARDRFAAALAATPAVSVGDAKDWNPQCQVLKGVGCTHPDCDCPHGDPP